MGITESRQLGEGLQEACAKAERAGSNQVFEFLDDTVNYPYGFWKLELTVAVCSPRDRSLRNPQS